MDLRHKIPLLVRNHMRLLPINGEAARDVVEVGTASIIPRKVAEDVIRVVAGNDIDSKTPANELVIEPAILSLFCAELNQRRPPGRPVTSELVRNCRGSILEDYYERCMRCVEVKTRYFVEDQLLTSDGFRQDRSFKDAISSGVREKDLSLLIDERLLRVEERAKARRLELTHDVLAEVAAASKKRRQEREKLEERERALGFPVWSGSVF